jgi:exodeoxyribonuclease VII large subunit
MGNERQVFSVSGLAEIIQALLEDSLPGVWVQGEISNFRNPTGHWYFTLKDAQAQIRCAMFKSTNFYVRPQPRDGDQVLIRGQLAFYAARGDLQIIVEHMEPAGVGALLRAFEELKKKLAAEGLFDEKLKRPFPAAPRGIGLVTSPTGAAVQDILTTLRRRFPLGSVYLYPVPVQGETAAAAIVGALRELPLRAPVDVLILARGGGSIEDLWCFNDERVARAIRACAVPVVVGVGHEIDFTIADFAADLRAATPTAAAELVSPDQAEWRARVQDLQITLTRDALRAVQMRLERLMRLQSRMDLAQPARRLQQNAQRLDELWERLLRAHSAIASHRRQRLLHVRSRLASVSPVAALAGAAQRLSRQGELLNLHLRRRLRDAQQRLSRNEDLLASFSPRATLERGYAIARGPDGRVLRDAARLQPGDAMDVTLAAGQVQSKVEAIR